MADTKKGKNGHTWTKAQHAKYAATINRIAAERNKLHNEAARPLDAHYVGEAAQAPVVDVPRVEEHAFRRGMFTALQMVVDLLIRELR